MNNMTDNEDLTNPSDYQVDIFVDHLDRNGDTLKSYTLRNAFPTALDDIALNYNTNNTIESSVVHLHISILKQILLHNNNKLYVKYNMVQLNFQITRQMMTTRSPAEIKTNGSPSPSPDAPQLQYRCLF